jgi:hypothetical protein
MNALRLNEGFVAETFMQRTGLGSEALEAPFERSRKKGLLETVGHRARTTTFGRAHLNALLREFL